MAFLLTSLRLLLVVPAALAFARSDFISPLLLLTLMSVAIATDFFDGIVARRTHTATPRGQLFDHATDFLFVTSGLTLAVHWRQLGVGVDLGIGAFHELRYTRFFWNALVSLMGYWVRRSFTFVVG